MRGVQLLWVVPAIFGLLLLFDCSIKKDPPVKDTKVVDWPKDSVDWVERLKCPDADGYVVLMSTNDFPVRERFYNVTYVLERNGRYYIGRRSEGPSITSDPPVKSWSIDTACCGCQPR